MARLLVTLNIGPLASPTVLESVFSDLTRSVNVAATWAQASAVEQARDAVDSYIRQGDSNRYELRDDEYEIVSAYRHLNRMWDEFGSAPPDIWFDELWHRWYRRGRSRYGRAAALTTFNPFSGPVAFEAFAPDLSARLVQREVLRLTPPPVAVERATYENPLGVTLQDFALGASLLIGGGGLVAWLDLARGFTPLGRRIRNAQARQEEARADEMEANARVRAAEASEQELRASLIEELNTTRNDGQSAAALLEMVDNDPSILRLLNRLSTSNPEYEVLPDDAEAS